MASDSQKIQQLRRVLLLYQLVKTRPQMSSKELQEELGIGKSTYNRDRKFMESMGIKFSYSKAKRLQIITQDAFLPIPDLSLDERLAIILALSQLGELQESFLAKHARAAASKLLASQDDSFAKPARLFLTKRSRTGVHHGRSGSSTTCSRPPSTAGAYASTTANRANPRKTTKSNPIRCSLSMDFCTWTGTALSARRSAASKSAGSKAYANSD